MPAVRKDVPDNLMLIVGQLLEATKAASEGLRSMSVEVQSNAKAIIAASKTIEAVEDKTNEIDKILRDATNPINIVQVTQGHTIELDGLHESLTELKDSVVSLRTEIGRLGSTTAGLKTTKDTAWEVVKFVGWGLTTAIALYAALAGK